MTLSIDEKKAIIEYRIQKACYSPIFGENNRLQTIKPPFLHLPIPLPDNTGR